MTKAAMVEQDRLAEILEHPPEDRALDSLWAGGATGATQRPLAWRTACRGGTVSAIAPEIPGLVAQLNEAKENLEICVARMMKREAAGYKHLIGDLESRIDVRTKVVLAAGGKIETDERGKVRVSGGWCDHDIRALDTALGQAEFNLREAGAPMARFRAGWPPPPADWERFFVKELRAEAEADVALKRAKKAHADSLALLTEDREELRKLRTRAA